MYGLNFSGLIASLFLFIYPVIYFFVTTIIGINYRKIKTKDSRELVLVLNAILYLLFCYSLLSTHLRYVFIEYKYDIEIFKYFVLIFVFAFLFLNILITGYISKSRELNKYICITFLGLLIIMIIFDCIKIKSINEKYNVDIKPYLEEKFSQVSDSFNIKYEGVSIDNKYKYEMIREIPPLYKRDFKAKYSVETSFLEKPFKVYVDKNLSISDNFKEVIKNDNKYINDYKNYLKNKIGIDEEEVKLYIKEIESINFDNIKDTNELYEHTNAIIDGLIIDKELDEKYDNYDEQFKIMLGYEKLFYDAYENELTKNVRKEDKNIISAPRINSIIINNKKTNISHDFTIYDEQIGDYILQTYNYKAAKIPDTKEEGSSESNVIEEIYHKSNDSYRTIITRSNGIYDYKEFKGLIPFNEDTYLMCVYMLLYKSPKENRKSIEDTFMVSNLYPFKTLIEDAKDIKIDFEMTEENIKKYWTKKEIPLIINNDKKNYFKAIFKYNEKQEFEDINLKKIEEERIDKKYSLNNSKEFTIGSRVNFGSYYQSDLNKKEALEWLIIDKNLENKTFLMITDKIINTGEFVKESEYADYEKSKIREYLNNEFYNEAFSANEKLLIVDTMLKEDKKELTRKASEREYREFSNKAFILTMGEVEKYFKRRQKSSKGTYYAANNGLDIRLYVDDYNFATWWTRTEDDRNNNMDCINEAGLKRALSWKKKGIGIRPCIRVKYE